MNMKELVGNFLKRCFALSGDADFASKSKRICTKVLRLRTSHTALADGARDERSVLRSPVPAGSAGRTESS